MDVKAPRKLKRKFRRDLPYTKKQKGTKGMSFRPNRSQTLVSSFFAIEPYRKMRFNLNSCE